MLVKRVVEGVVREGVIGGPSTTYVVIEKSNGQMVCDCSLFEGFDGELVRVTVEIVCAAGDGP